MFKFLFYVCKILLLLSISLYFLKGLPHEMELAYDDMYGYNSSGNKYGMGPFFKFFNCSNDFITQKVYSRGKCEFTLNATQNHWSS
jgi:hypothetical protein